MIESAVFVPSLFVFAVVVCLVRSINSECVEKTYHEQQLYSSGKYAIWQCQKRGHVPYYELRRKLRWWGEDVVTFDTDVTVVVKKLKQLEEFPSEVDNGMIQYIKTELENK